MLHDEVALTSLLFLEGKDLIVKSQGIRQNASNMIQKDMPAVSTMFINTRYRAKF